MEFSKSRRVGRSSLVPGSGLKQRKITLLDMYETPGEALPEFCGIEEFYQAAYDRLQVLQILEQLSSRVARSSVEFEPQLLENLKVKGLRHWVCGFTNPSENITFKQVDVMSHFTLRLAYCQSEELRRWFRQWETELFRCRLEREKSEVVRTFQEDWSLTFDPVDPAEKATVINSVISARPQANAQLVASSNLYKVHFTMVPDMVSKRRVFLKLGYAYLLPEDIKGIIVSEFRAYLSRTLSKLSKYSSVYMKDDQIRPLMKLLARRQIQGEQKFRDEGSVTPEELNDLSKEAYPLCMSSMHNWLREKHHLKHTGRLSFTLFLKGIGLSMEDSLKFFGQEFSRSIGPEKFSKEYAYAIRHAYGKEGKRADYRPYNCMKMISLHSPSGAECHGCPFKVLEPEALKNSLRSQGLTPGVLNEVVSDVKNHNYQAACTRVFEARAGRVLGTQIVHPNQFYEESLKVLQGTSQLATEHNKIEKQVVKIYKRTPKQELAEQPIKTEAASLNEMDDEDFENAVSTIDM